MRINPFDLCDALEQMGYVVDDDTGEVYIPPDHHKMFTAQKFLLELALDGHLTLDKQIYEQEIVYYIPHWKCFDGMDSYCKDFPNEQQCKYYDV